VLREEGNAKIILETMPIGVAVVDGSGAIQQLNGEARRIWGVGTAGLANCKDYIGWWPNTGRAIQRDEWAIARALDKGETTLCEISQVQSLDRTNKTVLNSATPLRNLVQITGAVDIMQDISGRDHVQSELGKARSPSPAKFMGS
jgi:PAS domain-containing protein